MRPRGSAAWRRDAHQCFAEIAAFQHADEGDWRILKAVGDVLAIADAAIGDSCADSAQERRVVIGGEFVVDVAAQSKTFAQYLAWSREEDLVRERDPWRYIGRSTRTPARGQTC